MPATRIPRARGARNTTRHVPRLQLRHWVGSAIVPAAQVRVVLAEKSIATRYEKPILFHAPWRGVIPASIRTVRRFLCEAAIVLLTAGLLLQPAWAQKSLMRADAPFLPDKATVRAAERYNRLGMIFEANRGQSSPDAKFLARGAGYDLRLTRSEAVLRFGKSKGKGLTQEEALVRMKVLDGNPDAQVAGERLLPGKSNYFVGKDAAKWVTNVAQFAKVRYRDMYPGVDLVYYGQQGELEYDFVVRPGVDPAVIRLDIEGASQLTIEHGDLQWNTSAGEVRFRRPSIYQEVNGARREIGGGYLLKRAMK